MFFFDSMYLLFAAPGLILGLIASAMTKESLAALELAEGDQVRVLVKAVHVLLLRD